MQPSDRSGFVPSGQDPVDEQTARLGALESQVAEAQAELEEYQRLLNELPEIYEEKFRQKLHSVAQEIRQLLNERKALQQQLGQALAETRQP
jgi:chromosome segregation ATPase